MLIPNVLLFIYLVKGNNIKQLFVSKIYNQCDSNFFSQIPKKLDSWKFYFFIFISFLEKFLIIYIHNLWAHLKCTAILETSLTNIKFEHLKGNQIKEDYFWLFILPIIIFIIIGFL